MKPTSLTSPHRACGRFMFFNRPPTLLLVLHGACCRAPEQVRDEVRGYKQPCSAEVHLRGLLWSSLTN